MTFTNKIKSLNLKGTKHQMGVQYGQKLQPELMLSLNILKDFYISEHGISWEKLVQKANKFYARYPYSYQSFIYGVSEGSGLTLDETKVLNGMETLSSLLQEKAEVAACTFMAVPASRSESGATIIGRNYDSMEPFNKIVKYLTVTVLHEPDTIPTAFISLPGQIYCPTCINKASLFIELNNGMPSGGYSVDVDKQSLLINLLQALQNSQDYDQLNKQLAALSSDYSLVINMANKSLTKSFEYSSFNGTKPYTPSADMVHVSTNFYLNDTWAAPIPSDESTWLGVSRRTNLLNMYSTKETISLSNVITGFDTKLHDGGPTWEFTIYQIIYDSHNGSLYLKRAEQDTEWQHIDLASMFNDADALPARAEYKQPLIGDCD